MNFTNFYLSFPSTSPSARRPSTDLHRLTILKTNERRNTHDIELPSDVGIFVHVAFADFNILAFIFLGDLLHDRPHHLARAAPRRPKIHQDGWVDFKTSSLKLVSVNVCSIYNNFYLLPVNICHPSEASRPTRISTGSIWVKIPPSSSE